MQDYKFCMKTEQNLEDEATLPWFAAILGLDFASNDQHMGYGLWVKRFPMAFCAWPVFDTKRGISP